MKFPEPMLIPPFPNPESDRERDAPMRMKPITSRLLGGAGVIAVAGATLVGPAQAAPEDIVLDDINLTSCVAQGGCLVTVTGMALDEVTRATIGPNDAPIESKTATELQVRVPAYALGRTSLEFFSGEEALGGWPFTYQLPTVPKPKRVAVKKSGQKIKVQIKTIAGAKVTAVAHPQASMPPVTFAQKAKVDKKGVLTKTSKSLKMHLLYSVVITIEHKGYSPLHITKSVKL